MVMLWNLVVLVGFVVERGGGQKAGHPTYAWRAAVVGHVAKGQSDSKECHGTETEESKDWLTEQK